MPSPLHEAIVRLFREHPALVFEALAELHLGVDGSTARLASEAAPLDPAVFASDAVVVVETHEAARRAFVIEVQLGVDEAKRIAWPVYLVTQYRSLDCPVWLVVVTFSQTVAAWAGRPIDLGHPGFVLRPIVLDLRTIPLVDDVDRARIGPHLALLSAFAHHRGDAGGRAAFAALTSLEAFDQKTGTCYRDLILSRLDGGARKALEAIMDTAKWEWQSDFAKQFVAEGIAQGKAEGKAEAVLAVLESRGVVVDPATRARVLSSRDSAQLDRWLARAANTEPGTTAAESLDND